jgi:hypothetical protein
MRLPLQTPHTGDGFGLIPRSDPQETPAGLEQMILEGAGRRCHHSTFLDLQRRRRLGLDKSKVRAAANQPYSKSPVQARHVVPAVRLTGASNSHAGRMSARGRLRSIPPLSTNGSDGWKAILRPDPSARLRRFRPFAGPRSSPTHPRTAFSNRSPKRIFAFET